MKTHLSLHPGDASQSLMARTMGGQAIALPHATEICLQMTWIANERLVADSSVETKLKRGGELRLQREAESVFDQKAVAVWMADGCKLGYLHHERSETIARLLDAGKCLRGVVECVARSPTGRLGIRVSIYMRNP